MRLSPVLFVLPFASLVAASNYQATVRFPDLPSNTRPRLLASDATGSLFIVSYLAGVPGRTQLHILKTDPAGKTLAATAFSFNHDPDTYWSEAIVDAAADSQGNLVILGTTSSTDFPLLPPASGNPKGFGAFVVKLDPQLKNTMYSARLSGTRGNTYAGALALGKAGNVYVTGSTTDPGFPVTAGAYQTQPPQRDDSSSARYAFLTEIRADFRAIVFSTYFGDSATACTGGASTCAHTFGVTDASAIALDTAGNVVIAGGGTATKLPTTSGVFGPGCGACASYPQSSAGFVAKFSSDGSKLRWASYIPVAPVPHTGGSDVTALRLDGSDNVVIGGLTSEGFPVTPGALQVRFPTEDFGFAGYIMKLDPLAQRVIFSTYFGLEDPIRAVGVAGMAVGAQGTIWITGVSLIEGFPPQDSGVLGEDYLAELSADGSALNTLFTAPGGAAGLGLVLSPAGSATVLGIGGSLLTATAGQGPSFVGIGNSAGAGTSRAVAPYELVSLYGPGLGPQAPVQALAVNGVLPTSLAGTQVLFNGIPAPILSTGPNRIDAIVPARVASSELALLRIITPSGELVGPALRISPAQPGVFTSPASNGFVSYAMALNQDGSVNSAANPAALGSLVTVWTSGTGTSSDPQPDGTIVRSTGGSPTFRVAVFSSPVVVILWIGDVPPGPRSLETLFAGDAPGMVAGVSQINFRLPAVVDSLTNVGFFLQIGDYFSNSFGIHLKPR